MQIGQETQLEIQGKTYKVLVKSIQGDEAVVVVDGEEMAVRIEGSSASPAPLSRPAATARPKASPPPASAPAAKAQPASPAPAGANSLTANMPGVVVKLLVQEGQEVKAQDVVLVLEAMKMENEIRAGRDGSVAAIHVQAGQRVQTGDPLISWK